MDTRSHTLEALFAQLGIPNSEKSMEAFFSNYHLPSDIPLERAAFWSASQAEFIHDALELNSDWHEAVDQLDARLHH